MVNTRRKSHVPTTEDSVSQIAEQSDSSTTSGVTRRSTRRSVGSVQTPIKEVATPTRRSRRLSNSSVESTNNDTPRPATRRSTRNKTAGSDNESSDVELLVIKRRKVVEGVETLGAITEEKNEADRSNQNQEKDQHIVIELERQEIKEIGEIREKSETPEIFEDCKETLSVDENHEIKVSSTEPTETTIEVEDLQHDKVVSMKLEENTGTKASENEVEMTTEETNVAQEEENKSSEDVKCEEVKEMTKENSPIKSETEKPRMLFGVPANLISVNPKNLIQTIQETQIGKYFHYEIF